MPRNPFRINNVGGVEKKEKRVGKISHNKPTRKQK